MTTLANCGWLVSRTPGAMSANSMAALRVVRGCPMPTGLAMVRVLRRWPFGHRRGWRRHVSGWRRSRHLGRWRCGLLLRAGCQADHRQSDKCVENRGLHSNQSLTRRKSGWLHTANSPFTLWLIACRERNSLWLRESRTLRHPRHTATVGC